MNKIYILYNLIESGELATRIERVIDNGFSFEELLTINPNDFFAKYGMKKYDFFFSLSNFVNFNKDCTFADLSIYYLLRHGISKRTIDGIYQKGLKKLFYVMIFEPATIQEFFGLKDLEISKLYALKEELLMTFYGDLYSIDVNCNPLFADMLIKDLKNSCYNFILSVDKTVSKIEIFNSMKDYQKRYFNELIENILTELLQKKKICETNGNYQVRKPTLDEFISTLDLSDRSNKFFVLHIDGMTYEEIARDENITRERVRQLISKVDCNFIDELKYLNIYNKYSIEEEEFTKIFNVSTRVYRYLRYKSKKRGLLPLTDLALEDCLSNEQRNIISNIIFENEKCIICDNNVIKANGVSLLGFYFQKFMQQPKKLQEIFDGYSKFLLENNISHLNCSYKSFVNKVNDLKYSVNNKNGYRYFEVFDEDVVNAINDLDFSNYKDVEISAKVIYDSNLDVMLNNNILDEYELYSLIKTHRNEDFMEFNRIPIINFGKGDRDRQIETIIIEFSPITIDDFATKYNELYGFEKNSITSYSMSKFGHYYQDGKFDLTTPVLPTDLVNKLKTLFVKDFYFKEDVLEIINKAGIKFDEKYFNSANLLLVGYKSNCSYIYSSKFSSFTDYMNEVYYNNDFINFENIDRRMFHISAFTDCFYQKSLNHEIIQYDNFKFVKFSYLEKNGVTKKDIEIFRKKLIHYVVNGSIFSLKSIRKSGFDDKLFCLGFDEYFYNSIIRHTENIYSRRIGNTKDFIFRYNPNEKAFPNFSELFVQILGIHKVMTPEDLSQYLKDNYGIERDVAKIKALVSEAGIYYDKETNNFYYGNESFEKEVVSRLQLKMYRGN